MDILEGFQTTHDGTDKVERMKHHPQAGNAEE
jgi:hypothetical protein